jgi:nucleotide-binding universal stress UspA family protein
VFEANGGLEGHIMFRTILVPLDGSSFAEQALPWALSIARRARASIDLVRGHVLYALLEPACNWVPYDPAMDAERRDEERCYLDSTAKRLAAVAPVATSTAVVLGLEADGILDYLGAGNADLVVMTTHGRGPLGRFIFGSMADRVVRRSTTPVLLIHPREPAPGLLPEPVVHRVLIPLDGSALAEQVLGPAIDLVQVLETPCELLRVIEPAAAEEEQEAEAYLRSLADRIRKRGLKVATRVVAGRNAAGGILAEARGDDVIALATHGRGGIGRILLGSVADRVIRTAACPVLVYRPALA